MEFTIQLLTAVIFWTSLAAVGCSNPSDICPKREGDTWRVDKKDGKDRCILSCSSGYAPSGCHVIRPRHGGDDKDLIPTCVEEPYVSSKTLLAVGGCAGVVVAIPSALIWAGFTAGGVAATSLASSLQRNYSKLVGPTTVAKATSFPLTRSVVSVGLFSTLQSAGAAGMSAWTKAKIGGVCYTTAEYVMYKFNGCEAE